MTWAQRLDRIWLWTIAIASLIGYPILAIIFAEKYGWPAVGLFVLVCVLIGVYRARSTAE